jgi:hypothetical protein
MLQLPAAGVAPAHKLVPLLAVALLMTGCAYIGSPLPPLANVPARVTDLAAIQRASRIILHFTVPTFTTEGVAIKPPLKLDVRIGPAGSDPDHQTPLPQGSIDKVLATYLVPSADFAGKEVAIAVRSIGPNGKSSAWSDSLTLPIVPAPPPPAAPKAEPTAEGVRLTWQGPAGDFRIFRRTGDDQALARLDDTGQQDWIDRTAEFGKRYTYIVQRIVKLPGGKEAESDLSAEIGITHADTFPPAAPSGLRAAVAPESVELSWERNTEPDLAGYRIYRAPADGPFESIAEVSQVPSYSDRAVEHGKTYRYAVSAFDQAGNESAKSAVAEAQVQ